MKNVQKLFKIKVVRDSYDKDIKMMKVIFVILIVSFILTFLPVVSFYFFCVITGVLFLPIAGFLLRLSLESHLVEKLTEEEINMINRDFEFKSGLIYSDLNVGFFDDYFFAYSYGPRFFYYRDIKKIAYIERIFDGKHFHTLNVNSGNDYIDVVRSEYPFDNKLKEIKEKISSNNSSIEFEIHVKE